MRYQNIVEGKFISRPNRFVAHVEIDGEERICHVKNTGRCGELLLPGATVYLEDFTGRMGSRKLTYSLIAVKKGSLLINMDSQAPNKVTAEALAAGTVKLPGLCNLTTIKPEATYGSSRLDFYVEDADGRKGFVEVKGVTLESGGLASFPDAPTQRGIKHLNELIGIKNAGLNAYALFVIQMSGMSSFSPNDERHQAFGDVLRAASKAGVHVLAYECAVTPDTLEVTVPVEIIL